MMRRVLVTAVLTAVTSLPGLALAQNACDARCHREASDCMKACTGDPREAQKPEHGKQLLACVATCQQRTKDCKQACTPPAPPPAPAHP